MFSDFEFTDDGRRVRCSRGVRNPSVVHLTDDRWWYLSLAGAPPVRLLRVTPGQTRGQVWESALRHLDRLESRRAPAGLPSPPAVSP
ncbi:MAG TPA: hypothetical protein VFJ82_04095 [Longimicrobium sp.]|nr:hypothetical protein [Longimicrobium sp.]